MNYEEIFQQYANFFFIFVYYSYSILFSLFWSFYRFSPFLYLFLIFFLSFSVFLSFFPLFYLFFSVFISFSTFNILFLLFISFFLPFKFFVPYLSLPSTLIFCFVISFNLSDLNKFYIFFKISISIFSIPLFLFY